MSDNEYNEFGIIHQCTINQNKQPTSLMQKSVACIYTSMTFEALIRSL